MQDIVVDINGVIYCNLFNHNNKFCWFISTLHKMHSSKSLNKLLLCDTNIPNDSLLTPLKIYAGITDSNYVKVYNDIKKWLNEAYDRVFSKFVKCGYEYRILIKRYYIPIIYQRYERHFCTIIGELNPYFLHSIDSCVQVTGLPVINDWDKMDIVNEYYENMVSSDIYKKSITDYKIDSIKQPTFVVGILMLNLISCSGGHAVVLIKTNTGYVVLDDQSEQKTLIEYVKSHIPYHLCSIDIIGLSDNDVNELNQYLSYGGINKSFKQYDKHKFTHRVVF